MRVRRPFQLRKLLSPESLDRRDTRLHTLHSLGCGFAPRAQLLGNIGRKFGDVGHLLCRYDRILVAQA